MQSAGQEFKIAIAGPAMSALLGVVLFGVGQFVPGGIGTTLWYLGFVNFALAIFNLLPGFPLDGGRVFRSMVWARTNDLQRSTTIATRVGGFIGWLIIAVGALFVLRGSLVGLWYMFIGFFLKSAADNAREAVTIERAIAGVTVAEVMRAAPPTVDGGITLERLIEEHVLRGERAVFVELDGNVAGVVTTTDLAKVPREQHGSTTAATLMVPAEQVVVASPEMSLQAALRLLMENDIHQLPVIEDGRFVGLLTRGDIFHHIETRRRFLRPRTHP